MNDLKFSKKAKFICVVFASVLIVTVGAFCLAKKVVFKETPKSVVTKSNQHFAQVMQAEKYVGLRKYADSEVEKEVVKGVVVSHHFYMEPEISKTFLKLRAQKPSVVVVLGPNHFNAGESRVLVSKQDFVTPFGVLSVRQDLAQQMQNLRVANIEERPFENEHAISSLVTSIKKVWPETTLLPVILKRGTSDVQLQSLTNFFAESLPEDALVVASVDFSHHLNAEVAEFHDAQSIDALQSGDIKRIKNLEVDSPESLSILVSFMSRRGALEFKGENTNQAIVAGNPSSTDVTSYVFGYFFNGRSKGAEVVTLQLLPPMEHLWAEETALKGEDILGGLLGPEGNFLRGSDMKIVPLVDAEGVCQPEGGGAVSLKLAQNLRKYRVQYVYLPHTSCKPSERLPASLGGFVDLQEDSLEARPFLNLQLNGRSVLLAHMPSENFQKTRTQVLQEIKMTGNKQNQKVLVFQPQYDEATLSLLEELKTKVTVISLLESSSFDAPFGKFLGLGQPQNGTGQMYGLVMGEGLKVYSFRYTKEKDLPQLLLK